MLTVSYGTVIWTTLAFLIVVLLLKRMAWSPILESIKEREGFIKNSLNDAHKAKEELVLLKSKNEDLIKQSRVERDALIKDAREARETMLSEAKGESKAEAERILATAQQAIENEKMLAITELKNQVAQLSIEIAEKILKEELSSEEKQKKLVDNLLEDVNLN